MESFCINKLTLRLNLTRREASRQLKEKDAAEHLAPENAARDE